MQAKRKLNNKIKSSEITPESVYHNRRSILKTLGILSTGLTTSFLSANRLIADESNLQFLNNSKYSTNETLNSYEDITTYNNFYEFGMQKTDPFNNSGQFEPKPWRVKVSGKAKRPVFLILMILSTLTL